VTQIFFAGEIFNCNDAGKWTLCHTMDSYIRVKGHADVNGSGTAPIGGITV
jgi:hypothetical protein